MYLSLNVAPISQGRPEPHAEHHPGQRVAPAPHLPQVRGGRLLRGHQTCLGGESHLFTLYWHQLKTWTILQS